jgi:hypothetical protein
VVLANVIESVTVNRKKWLKFYLLMGFWVSWRIVNYLFMNEREVPFAAVATIGPRSLRTFKVRGDSAPAPPG